MEMDSSTLDADAVLALPPSLSPLLTQGEALSRHCSLRIGGTAQFWGTLNDLDQLRDVVTWANQHQLPIYMLGLGSNVLIHDDGLRGVVLKLVGDFATAQIVDSTEFSSFSAKAENDEKKTHRNSASTTYVRVGAGMVNAHLVRWLLKEQLLGGEFLSLIPGTMGGAVVMNAGIKERCLKDVLISVQILHIDTLQVVEIPAESLKIEYRHCHLPDRSIVLGAVLRLEKGDLDEVKAANDFMRSQKEMRNERQPYRLASVGSTFRNPEGDAAGRLIDACGLKGKRVGHAVVSDLHANFFINEGGATAQEFAQLMSEVKLYVFENTGKTLVPEVRFLGFDESELDQMSLVSVADNFGG